MRRTVIVVAVLALAAFSARAQDQELPPGPNRALVYGQCRTCHDLQYLVESAGITRDDWDEMLDSMKQYGLRIPADQRAKILEYLGTYLGPNPPPAQAASASGPTATVAVDGAKVYAEQCTACHQADGQGVPGQFPPLAGNPDLFLARDFPAHVLLFGIEGEISVGGKKFQGAMPPFSHLSDPQIAAVINYLREAWGNGKVHEKAIAPLTTADIKALRTKTQTSVAVHAYRAGLK
jgi:mono/diheme cytochrome c family protein